MTIPPIVWAAAAAELSALLLGVWPEASVAVAGLATLTLVMALRRKRRLLATVVAGIAISAVSVSWHAPLHDTGTLQGRHEVALRVTGTVIPSHSANAGPARSSAQVRIERVDGRPVERDAIALGELCDASAWGDRLGVRGTLESARGVGPRRILLRVEECHFRAPGGGLFRFAREVRSHFARASSAIPGVAGELLPGLALGDTSRVSEQTADTMRAASLTHLTAVSGANCAVVIAAVWGTIARLGGSRRARVVGALGALGGFVILVGPEPSVLRAAVMALIALIGIARGQPLFGLGVLAIGVLALLAIDPVLAWNLGFVLSVAATAGLLLWSGPLTERLTPMLGRTARLVAIPLAAELACQPIIALMSPQLSLWGVPSNILAGWFAPLATALGLLGALLLALWPWVGTLLVWCAAVPAAAVGHIAAAASTLPGSRLPLPEGLTGSVLLASFGVLLLLGVLAARPRTRCVGRIGAAGLALVLVGVLGVAPSVRQLSRPSGWQIAACPVGQGDAFLIRTDRGFVAIDTGPDPLPLRHCLNVLGVPRVELLVLTHYDRDHVGGVSALAGRVDRAWVGPVGDAHGSDVRASLELAGTAVREVRRGESLSLGSASLRVLWPDGTSEPGNDSSVTVELTVGSLTAVFLGDLGAEAQEELRHVGVPHDIDIVKVAHHGSADQSAALYSELHPRLGLIGVGSNRYGHPTPSCLAMLRAAGIAMVRTDRAGIALVDVENDDITLWTESGRGPEP